MRAIATFVTAVVSFSLYVTLQASTYGWSSQSQIPP